MDRKQMRTWAEISLENLEHNYRALRACTGVGCRFMGMVKADAYGHGAVPVAKKLAELGTDYLAVASLEEGLELRKAGVQIPVLILGVTPAAFSREVVENDLTQTVCDLEHASFLSAAAKELGKTAKVHLKVDTGMSRLGVPAHDVRSAADLLAPICALSSLEAEGIFTHFACADEDEETTMAQFTRFLDVVDYLKNYHGVKFALRHCAASAAVLHYPCTHLDMIRPGIALYGHYPHPSCEGLDGPGLRPVMTLKTRVASVKELPADTAVSYGGTYVLQKDSRVAVLPVGYGDGLRRALSGKMSVLVNGQRAEQIGRICMDLCMLDVSHLPDAAEGDEVVLFGEGLPLEDMAATAETIPYELLCAVSPRVPRIY